ncbi:MAG: DUF3592 domain-containing protein [Burkholderiales bacterium]|nr:DUF3592 domain-containing protein [Burkholderiales bacterium]
MRKQGNGMVWLLFGPVLLTGLGLIAAAGWRVAQHLQSLHWKPVEGMLVERGVEATSASLGRRQQGTSRLSGSFSYAWQGKAYTSDQISFSALSESSGANLDDWNQRLDNYLGPDHSKFTVWVNPADPAQAVALRDIRWLEIGFLAGLGAAFAISAGALLHALYAPKDQPPQFSWRAVAIMAGVGAPLSVLAPLLWRDSHGVWAGVVLVPLLLALHGVVYGLRLRARGTPGPAR